MLEMVKHNAWATTCVSPKSEGSMPAKRPMKPSFRASSAASQARENGQSSAPNLRRIQYYKPQQSRSRALAQGHRIRPARGARCGRPSKGQEGLPRRAAAKRFDSESGVTASTDSGSGGDCAGPQPGDSSQRSRYRRCREASADPVGGSGQAGAESPRTARAPAARSLARPRPTLPPSRPPSAQAGRAGARGPGGPRVRRVVAPPGAAGRPRSSGAGK